MSDYLFDGEGPREPEIERLEQLLAPYRYRGEPGALPRPRRRVPRAAAAAAATAVAAAVAVLLWTRRPAADLWAVQPLAGSPRCDGRPCVGLGPEGALETDPTSRARVSVGRFGHLDVEPGTAIRRRPAPGEQRLALLHGTVSARVVAPPRLVVVETASARAVDLGCEYTLSVDAAGNGRLRVASGWVALEAPHGAVIVPRGAEAALHGGGPPGTPVFADAGAELRAGLDVVDAGLAAGAVDAPALDRVLGAARLRDTLSLFNLLPRLPPEPRARVLDRMLALGAPLPASMPRAALLGADPDALERWRHTLSSIWL
jgi:hypothetical protein